MVVVTNNIRRNNMNIEPKAYQLLVLKAGLKTWLSGSKMRLTRAMTTKAILKQVSRLTGNEYKVSKYDGTKALRDLEELIELYKSPSYNA